MPGAKKKEDTEINAAEEEIKEEELDYWTCDECGKIFKKNSLYVYIYHVQNHVIV